MTNSDDRSLLYVIEKIGPLEWKRYNQRYPETWVNNNIERVDKSTRPPATSFRFRDENPKVITLLQEALDSYEGKIKWSLIGQTREYNPGTNRCVLPTYVEELREKTGSLTKVYDYISENNPDFGPVAFEDLIGLAEHVRSVFKNAGYDV